MAGWKCIDFDLDLDTWFNPHPQCLGSDADVIAACPPLWLTCLAREFPVLVRHCTSPCLLQSSWSSAKSFNLPFVTYFGILFSHTRVTWPNTRSCYYYYAASQYYTVSQEVPSFKLSVTSSNLNRFSIFLHCWKAYEICHNAHTTLPTSPYACCHTTEPIEMPDGPKESCVRWGSPIGRDNFEGKSADHCKV